jgi:hypothetical protein
MRTSGKRSVRNWPIPDHTWEYLELIGMSIEECMPSIRVGRRVVVPVSVRIMEIGSVFYRLKRGVIKNVFINFFHYRKKNSLNF